MVTVFKGQIHNIPGIGTAKVGLINFYLDITEFKTVNPAV